MKKVYEKPVITKLETGFMNKFGSSPLYARKIRKDIDGVPIDELIENFGSPLFVISEKKLREKYREAYNAFSSRYPNVQFGWSYKTNYLQAVCSVLHQEGAIAEVVSAFEYEKARKLGIDGKDIIFNGPHKPFNILEKAAIEGAKIHIDHFDEILDLEKVADKIGKNVKVAIRLNMDTGIHPQWSRFGFNLESGQALDAVKRIASGGKLILNGLHCHIGTYILEPEAYAREVEKMIKFAYEIEDNFGFKIEYIDIGGGFPSKSKLKGTYLPPDVIVPSVDEFAEKITEALYKNLRPNDFPTLVLESGRAIIDEAEYLITTVFASKRLPDGKKSYIVDAGVNLLYTAFWYNFEIFLDKRYEGLNEPSIINGPLCMNIDVISELMLPPLERGSVLAIYPVGAYNITQSMQFIRYKPRVVLIDKNSKVHLIREMDDLDYVRSKEKIVDV